METEPENGFKCHNYLDNVDENVEKCRKWLDTYSLSDSNSVNEDNSVADDLDIENVVVFGDDMHVLSKSTENNNEIVNFSEVFNKQSNHYENIQIYKSQNVHIGDITHINGPIYVNSFAPTLNQNIFINPPAKDTSKKFCIVSRLTWLAQPPIEPDDVEFFKEPAKFVIISHSATEQAFTQTDNNLIVRLIQQFHIESRKWNDISYNFLIGADGSIYEGRGWKVVGAHAMGYNHISIGICFIGCYMNKLPPASVLEKAKAFIKHGVEIGAIAEDYKLLGHRQCSSTESPGSKLFEEIKTWDRWDSTIDIHNPFRLNQTSDIC